MAEQPAVVPVIILQGLLTVLYGRSATIYGVVGLLWTVDHLVGPDASGPGSPAYRRESRP